MSRPTGPLDLVKLEADLFRDMPTGDPLGGAQWCTEQIDVRLRQLHELVAAGRVELDPNKREAMETMHALLTWEDAKLDQRQGELLKAARRKLQEMREAETNKRAARRAAVRKANKENRKRSRA